MKFKIGQIVFVCSINLSNTDYEIFKEQITDIDTKNKKYIFDPAGTKWYVSETFVFDNEQDAKNYGESNIEKEVKFNYYF